MKIYLFTNTTSSYLNDTLQDPVFIIIIIEYKI